MTAEEFREALEILGFSQAAYARRTGYTIGYVNRWAMGRKPIPLIVEVALMAELRAAGEGNRDEGQS